MRRTVYIPIRYNISSLNKNIRKHLSILNQYFTRVVPWRTLRTKSACRNDKHKCKRNKNNFNLISMFDWKKNTKNSKILPSPLIKFRFETANGAFHYFLFLKTKKHKSFNFNNEEYMTVIMKSCNSFTNSSCEYNNFSAKKKVFIYPR